MLKKIRCRTCRTIIYVLNVYMFEYENSLRNNNKVHNVSNDEISNSKFDFFR